MRPARGRTAAAAALAVGLLLAGCTSALGEAADLGDQKGYVDGSGTYTFRAAADRGEPVDLTGTDATGAGVDVADWRGGLVVVNVWYAACAPCRAEAPVLAGAATAAGEDGVRFVGVNSRDDAATAQAFESGFGIPYPTILDADSGEALLALRGQVPPQAVPTTLVLDDEGRPAARYLGRLEPGILEGMLEDVRADRVGAAGAAGGSTA